MFSLDVFPEIFQWMQIKSISATGNKSAAVMELQEERAHTGFGFLSIIAVLSLNEKRRISFAYLQLHPGRWIIKLQIPRSDLRSSLTHSVGGDLRVRSSFFHEKLERVHRKAPSRSYSRAHTHLSLNQTLYRGDYCATERQNMLGAEISFAAALFAGKRENSWEMWAINTITDKLAQQTIWSVDLCLVKTKSCSTCWRAGKLARRLNRRR